MKDHTQTVDHRRILDRCPNIRRYFLGAGEGRSMTQANKFFSVFAPDESFSLYNGRPKLHSLCPISYFLAGLSFFSFFFFHY